MANPEFRNTLAGWEVHRSARKHGVSDVDILHAATRALVAYDLGEGPDGGPPRELRLGPDRSGNLLELVALDLIDGRSLVIHAMPMRSTYHHLLPGKGG